MLRQDPNVIMLGEIRDSETAEIALTAAQTGHMLLSTLHTNNAISAITRLLDLNVPAYLVSSSVSVIIAQRLVRKLCACRGVMPATERHRAQMQALGNKSPGARMYVPAGCAHCNEGYSGRIGMFELLLLEEHLRAAIRSGSRDDELRELAQQEGMKLMQQDALEKVEAGITTLEEVLRVVPFSSSASRTCLSCKRPLSASFLFCPYCATPVQRGKDTGNNRYQKELIEEQA
jgi:type II secretory ATPase GspE/PulE/Tfp pilus assembly ATPase PilB-like protein